MNIQAQNKTRKLRNYSFSVSLSCFVLVCTPEELCLSNNIMHTCILTLQWLGLKFPETAVYFDLLRECYEAYVLYNFLCYLLNFLESNYDLPAELEATIEQPVPFCCLSPWPPGARFVRWCKVGVLQYTVVRIVLTVIAL